MKNTNLIFPSKSLVIKALQNIFYSYWGIVSILSFTHLDVWSQNPNSVNPMNSEKHRPLFHFSPPKNWMNDPNGMVYYQGEYHLFYQHYPDQPIWGPMHWGHAISKDLVHWQHLPIALFPDSLGYIFSGSAVVDWQNSSGLGSRQNPPIVAVYTYHSMSGEKSGRQDFQNQGIAYSLDKGRTWQKYAQNPVLKSPQKRDFRDPKVFWYAPTQKWLMTLAVADHIEFYSSQNLKDWSFESAFGVNLGAHGGVWECPDLFELPINGNANEKKWVLLVSINPGGPNGGSATQYFIGDFDGQSFKNLDSKTRWVDYGTDNYAGVTWSDLPQNDSRRIFLGWMSNWNYANQVPTENWRSANTIPRTLSLVKATDDFILTSSPVVELQKLRQKKQKIKAQSITQKINLDLSKPSKSGAYELILNLDLTNDSQDIAVEFKNSLGEKLMVGYEKRTNQFYIDRSNAGQKNFKEGFAEKHFAPRLAKNSTVKLHIFLDVASVELFADDGQTVMTDIFFPNKIMTDAQIISNASFILKSGEIYGLKSIF